MGGMNPSSMRHTNPLMISSGSGGSGGGLTMGGMNINMGGSSASGLLHSHNSNLPMNSGYLRDELPEDLSYEIPFKAIYSLAEWTNVAVNTLSAVNSILNTLDTTSSNNNNNNNNNNMMTDHYANAEVQQTIIQLVET
jgi:hypothetical protein